MALIRKDRVLETSTTTGTGALTLAGAVDTYRTFASVCSTNDTCYYFIKGAAGTGEWEVGLGTYSGTNTLTRTTVLDSSNSGSAVNFSAGAKQVGIGVPAGVGQPALGFRGALVYKNSTSTGQNYSSATAIAFDAESYDTDSIHDNSTNNTRLTVPPGVTKVRVLGQVAINNDSGTYTELSIWKNAGFAFAGFAAQRVANNGDKNINVSSPVQTVTSGDYFELLLQNTGDNSIDVVGTRTWFAMEIVA